MPRPRSSSVSARLSSCTIWSSVSGLQHVNAAARKQRAVDLERRILGGGADQADVAFFHVGQKGILLRFVEAVNLVDEDDGARAVLAGAFGVGHDLLDFLDPGEHGGELDELRLGHAGDDLRQRGLAGARRSPEDERTGVVALDLRAQGLAGTDQLFLPGKFFERARTHAVRQRPRAVGGACRRSEWVGKVPWKIVSPQSHRDSRENPY